MNGDSEVRITFSMESRSTLWNVIFEGFDQEVILVTRLHSTSIRTVNILKNFAVKIQNRFKDCAVDIEANGIVIRKLLPKNDITLVNKWENLMIDLKDNICEISK